MFNGRIWHPDGQIIGVVDIAGDSLILIVDVMKQGHSDFFYKLLSYIALLQWSSLSHMLFLLNPEPDSVHESTRKLYHLLFCESTQRANKTINTNDLQNVELIKHCQKKINISAIKCRGTKCAISLGVVSSSEEVTLILPAAFFFFLNGARLSFSCQDFHENTNPLFIAVVRKNCCVLN